MKFYLVPNLDAVSEIGIKNVITAAMNQAFFTLSLGCLLYTSYSLRFLEQALELPVYFENDANAAMLAEKKQKYPNAIYINAKPIVPFQLQQSH